ncbi:MAG TPA: hypothetical protein VGV37_21865 [Aliidongia sp.]|uniref:hypothetical protein n=1 Tax=Aliidongia sp. TaxID=1914230 RepID=UPI002DDCACA8|nr:hypothetical protein [Aliidongia sp.]HEV2677189.1 hypothetical protein [Aliidongia sp.]
MSELDWVLPWAGETADVLSLEDIGAVSCGMLVEELFGVVMPGDAAAGALLSGAVALGGVAVGPLLLD